MAGVVPAIHASYDSWLRRVSARKPWLSFGLPADSVDQPCDEVALPFENLVACPLRREPFCAVDLGEGRQAAAPRRPFKLERVGLEHGRIEVAFDRKGRHDLAAPLNDFAERHERTARLHAGLLLEFPDRYRERILCGRILSLRDRPGAKIFASPERAARVHEQELEARFATPVHQDASASLRHL